MAKKQHRRPPRSSADECGGAPPVPSSFPSPSSSSSSSDFEFTISLSPTSRSSSTHLCPADDLFYMGQLLPLHLSPRLHMVRTLILSSSSSSSTSTSRDSSGSSADSTSSLSATDLLLLHPAPDCDSSRPSSAAEDDTTITTNLPRPRPKYLSSLATKFSSVFHRSKKDSYKEQSAVKEVLKKCVRKVKPLYNKISSLQHHHHHDQSHRKKTFSFSIRRDPNKKTFITSTKQEPILDVTPNEKTNQLSTREIYNHSFSGNLRYPRRNHCTTAASCPSSIRSSPSHSGLLAGVNLTAVYRHNHSCSSTASIEDLQSAIQGAIAHCKSTMKKETPVGEQI